MTRRNAFTLLELLVVLAIVVAIASVLFPVFLSVKASAKQTSCMSNFKNSAYAVSLYLSDYNEHYMPANYQPGLVDSNSRTDRTWVQLIMPYVRDFRIFRCPADETDRPRREATFSQDVIPGDTYAQYYTASLRTNLGYNYIAFSPMFRNAVSKEWFVRPQESSMVAATNTLLFIDSRWTLDESPRNLTGGGSFLVVPPCRYERRGNWRIDTFKERGGQQIDEVFTAGTTGWKLESRDDPQVYGGVWPWHSGRITVVKTDLSAKAMTPDALQVGCDVLPNWQGDILNTEVYPWDLK